MSGEARAAGLPAEPDGLISRDEDLGYTLAMEAAADAARKLPRERAERMYLRLIRGCAEILNAARDPGKWKREAEARPADRDGEERGPGHA